MNAATRPRRLLGAAALPFVVAFAGCSSSGPVTVSEVPSGSAAGTAPSTASRSTSSPATTARTSPTTAGDEGSTSTSRGAGQPIDVCELITEADASQAFGQPAMAGTQSTDECWWSTANDLKTVNVIRRSEDLDQWRSGYQNSSWEPIDLGDEGYAGKGLDSITFRLGDEIYEINVVYSTKGDPKQVVNDLAQTVRSRL